MSTRDKKSSTEALLIKRIKSAWGFIPHRDVVLGIGDDCSITRVAAGDELLLTTDQVIENQHFVRGKHPVGALGHKALVRSLSDVAAMGGRPKYFLLSLALPDWAVGNFLEEFMVGMRSAADLAGLEDLALAGGDVARADFFSANVTVAGSVPAGRALLRSRARPRDLVYVSGALGGSLCGLRRVLAGETDLSHPAVERHCQPTAQLALGTFLRESGATAAIDLSDGLSTDGRRVADASGVAIRLEAERIPLFTGASLEDGLASGEEYELLFTAPPDVEMPGVFERVELTRIGVVEEGGGLWIGDTIGPIGFDHFSK